MLIASTVGEHPFHSVAHGYTQRVPKGARVTTCLHAVAEYYSTITKSRLPYSLSPAAAERQIAQLSSAPALQWVAASARAYTRALALARRAKMVSGGIYDALHLACAEAAGCDRLVTLNGKDFLRMDDATDVEIVALR